MDDLIFKLVRCSKHPRLIGFTERAAAVAGMTDGDENEAFEALCATGIGGTYVDSDGDTWERIA